jgi:cobalt/nickel transport system permease protein
MHIADGQLPNAVVIGGLAGAAVVVGTSLRWLAPANVSRVGLLTAAFFVASSIHIPFGPVSVHLLLNGLVGIVLGPLSSVAMLVALALQALLLFEGGITVIGFNLLSMTCGAMLARTVFDVLGGRRDPARAAAAGFLGGAVAVVASAFMVVVALWLAGENWARLREAFLIAHLPIALIEGLVTGSAASFIVRVKPDLLRSTWSRSGVCPLHSAVVHS